MATKPVTPSAAYIAAAWAVFASEGMAALLNAHVVRAWQEPTTATLALASKWAAAYADAMMLEWGERFGT